LKILFLYTESKAAIPTETLFPQFDILESPPILTNSTSVA
jgi:hypothetical protein